MTAEVLLTKDELDALIGNFANRRMDLTSGLPGAKETIMPYELVNPEDAVARLLPILETIHERFAGRLRAGLCELLRRDADVVANAIEMQVYTDFTAALSTPCSVNLIGMSPLSGPALLVFEQQLVFVLVDLFFGGPGQPYSSLNARDFTPTESRFIQRLLKLIFNHLEAAWQPFVAVRCTHLNAENNPQLITAISPAEILAVTRLKITVGGLTSSLQLALPCPMFEPVRALLLTSRNPEHPSHDERLTRLLREGLKDSQVGIRALLAETELTLGELLDLQVGDFIPIALLSRAVLEAEGVPVYTGQSGASQGWRALKIEQPLTALTSQSTDSQ